MGQEEGQPVFYLGSLSFEERCLGALRSLSKKRRSLTGVLLDYGSDATFGTDAARLRQEHWREAEAIAVANRWTLRRVESKPYSMVDIESNSWLSCIDPAARLVIDISCMTKVHVVGAAVALVNALKLASFDWTASYSQPQNYGAVAASYKAGWRGNLVVGLGAGSTLRNEGLGIGLLLPGAEVQRSLIAIEELETSAGALVFVITPNRPDIHMTTKASNSTMVDYLLRQKLAGPRVVQAGIERLWPGCGWRSIDVQESSLIHEMSSLMKSLVATASKLDGPIVLYPMGPKDAVFAAALYLSVNYMHASWIVYPVLATHPIDYSEGVRAVRWHSGEGFNSSGYLSAAAT